MFQDSGSGEEDDAVSSDGSRSPSPAEMERSYSSEGSTEAAGSAAHRSSAKGNRLASSRSTGTKKPSAGNNPLLTAAYSLSTFAILTGKIIRKINGNFHGACLNR